MCSATTAIKKYRYSSVKSMDSGTAYSIHLKMFWVSLKIWSFSERTPLESLSHHIWGFYFICLSTKNKGQLLATMASILLWIASHLKMSQYLTDKLSFSFRGTRPQTRSNSTSVTWNQPTALFYTSKVSKSSSATGTDPSRSPTLSSSFES